jgi:hypothetical protein
MHELRIADIEQEDTTHVKLISLYKMPKAIGFFMFPAKEPPYRRSTTSSIVFCEQFPVL